MQNFAVLSRPRRLWTPLSKRARSRSLQGLVRFMILAASLLLPTRPLFADDPQYAGRPLTAWVNDLGDLDGRVRLRAVVRLAKLGAPAVPMLERALDSSSKDQRLWALTVLGMLTPIPTDVLERALSKSDPEIRLRAAQYLSRHDRATPAAIKTLTESLSSSAVSAQLAALTALSQTKAKPPNLTSAVAPLLSSSNPDVRRMSALVLSTLTSEQSAAGKALLTRLPSETDSAVTLQIIESIGAIGYRDARPSFERMKPASPDAIRAAIDSALDRMK